MSLQNILRKFGKRDKPESFTRSQYNAAIERARENALETAEQSTLEKALKRKLGIPLDAVDYIVFQADGKHTAKFYQGIIKMGCETHSPGRWLSDHEMREKRAKQYEYSELTKQKYMLFFKMCLKTQELDLAVEEFRAKKMAELQETTQPEVIESEVTV